MLIPEKKITNKERTMSANKEQLLEGKKAFSSGLKGGNNVASPDGRRRADDTAGLHWTMGSVILHNEVLRYSTSVAWKQHLLIAIFLFRFNNNLSRNNPLPV